MAVKLEFINLIVPVASIKPTFRTPALPFPELIFGPDILA